MTAVGARKVGSAASLEKMTEHKKVELELRRWR